MSEDRKRRVLIGIPAVEGLLPHTDEDYAAMMYYFGRRYQDYDFFLGIKRKSEQFRARNSILEAAYQVDADFCLMLDDDQVFAYKNKSQVSDAYEFLRKLIAHMDADTKLGLVGGLYYHKGGQVKPVLLVDDESKPGEARYLRDDELYGRLQPVAVQGGGCMLIRMKALDFCAHPWFEPELKYGTDFQICMKMRKAGFKVACDTSIFIGHVSNERRIITPENRHQIHAESSETAEDLAMSGRISGVYQEYEKEVSEYTGKTHDELGRLEWEYAREYKPNFPSDGTPDQMRDYYKNSGMPYLARTIFYKQPQWDDYLLRLPRLGMPGQGMDIGCGSARISLEFAKAGHRLWYKDIDGQPCYEFLKWRAKKHGIDGTTAIFDGEPEDGSCDYVLFLDSIEHMTDWQENIDLAVRKLKPEGVIVSNFLMNFNYTNPEHIFMDKDAFNKYMTSRGMFMLNPAIWKKQIGPATTGHGQADKKQSAMEEVGA